MPHLRRRIREKVKEVVTGLQATGDQVFTSRTRNLAAGHAPTLLIYTPAESSSRSANGDPPENERPLQVFIEGRVSDATAPDDHLDDIALEVEKAMWESNDLGGLVSNLQYVGMQMVTEGPGERQIGGIRLEYRCTYRTLEGNPEQPST